MSLVLGCANKDNAIITSDGRAVGEYFRSESCNKTMKINKNIIVGFVGIKERVEVFVSHILRETGSERNKYFIEDFLDMIDFHMKEIGTQNNLEEDKQEKNRI